MGDAPDVISFTASEGAEAQAASPDGSR